MAEIIRMPKMSDTMTEGVIAKWHKKVGDTVKVGELIAEIETDKATMDYESYNEGVVLHLGAGEGKPINVDDVLAIIGKKGEDYSALLNETSSDNQQNTREPTNTTNGNTSPPPPLSSIKATIIPMPKMSDTMTEGIIAKWHKKVGDTVKVGELIAEIETDKATMDYESYNEGVLLYKGAEEQQAIAVDSVLAIVGEKDADWKQLLDAHHTVPEPATPNTAPPSVENNPVIASTPDTNQYNRIKASPLAKKIAKEKGYDINKIQGSGDGGRIIKRDVEKYSSKASAKSATPQIPTLPTGEERYEEIPLSQTRKTIARRLSESKFTAPHFYLTMEINMDQAVKARNSINEIAPTKISFNDIVTKAVATALRQNPDVNVSWGEHKIIKNHHIHIGIAVAVDQGLVVPVVRFVDSLSLHQIAVAIKGAAQKAKEKKLQPPDFEGSTFTISNLGMFGIEAFTAIVNPPNACILAVGAIQQKPIVKNREIVPGHTMKVTLSCDHRTVDGAVGATFLKTLKNLLEDPVRILI